MTSDIDRIFQRGCELLEEGAYEEAEVCFSEVILRTPDSEGAWGNRGFARMEMGNDQGALEDFGAVVDLNPSDPFGYAFRGMVLYYLGERGSALASAARALELADDEEGAPPASLTRALLFIRACQFEAACDDLEEYHARAPDDEFGEILLDRCRRVRDSGERLCDNGPDGQLLCNVCQFARCGFSFNTEPNKDWQEHGGRCRFEHCIDTMPARGGDGEGICPLYGHDCPGGEEEVQGCNAVSEWVAELDQEGATDFFGFGHGLDDETCDKDSAGRDNDDSSTSPPKAADNENDLQD